jgi:hypothetical protein
MVARYGNGTFGVGLPTNALPALTGFAFHNFDTLLYELAFEYIFWREDGCRNFSTTVGREEWQRQKSFRKCSR